MHELKFYGGVMYNTKKLKTVMYNTEKWRKIEEELTCHFEIYINLMNFDPGTWKSQKYAL